MREKTMDKMIACLTIAIIIMIVLFAVNIVLAVNDSKNTKTMANTESTADETGTSDDKNSEEADSDNQEESGTVVDNSEVQTSGNLNDTEATATEKVTADVSQDYILPDSDSKYYTKSELSSLSKSDLRIARNEIYARNGYIFKDETLKSYFQGKSWYKGTTNDQKAVESKFNKYEKKNRDIIVELEEN
jgi:hypothetical protein